MSAAHLASLLRAEGATSVAEHATLADAYRAALGAAQADARIIVFGSFSTVAEVMRQRQVTDAPSSASRQGG
jgi:folylpolyglutamate synthase/dihydropteroate synthase